MDFTAASLTLSTSSAFLRESSLAWRGTEFVNAETLMNAFGATDAVETGGGEDECVGLTFRPFAKARVDVAAHVDELDVRAQGEDHRFAAWAGGADACAHGQHVKTPEALADEGVTGVGARWGGGEGEARVEGGGEIFERVHGDVDAPGGERVLDLLDEDALGVEGRAVLEGRRGLEGRVLHAVAGGADDLDRDVVAARAELISDVVGLPEREFGAARADAKCRSTHR